MNASTPRVLLLDDDEFLLDMYAVKFKERGVSVTAFQSPEKALEHLKNNPAPDLLITDVVMPGIGGFEFLKEVRALNLSSMPLCVVLSNQGQEDDLDQAQALGAIGYIIKANAIPSEVIDKCLSMYQQHTTSR